MLARMPMNLHDPRALLQAARARYDREVAAYECTFFKQDRVGGELTARQKIEVVYRESPHTLMMTWVENAVRVKRALYAAGRLRDGDGQECAMLELTGPVARLCAGKVTIPIHGALARKSSRYSLDQFGFKATLDRIERDNAKAAARGELKLRYLGIGRVDGRPTHVIERRLPYTGHPEGYPQARLVVHLDQEWLLPVSVESYADNPSAAEAAGGEQLLASYLVTDVKFHREIADESFEF